MRAFFIMAGCVWFGLALLFVFSVACAARRAIPSRSSLAPRRDTSVEHASCKDSDSLAEPSGVTQEMIDA